MFNWGIDTVYIFFGRLASIGVESNMSYLESKKIKMLNLMALCFIPVTFLFSCLNLIDGRPLLSIINLSNCIACSSLIFLHWQRKYKLGRALFLFLNFVFFALGALFYHTGGEVFLFAILIVFLLVYDNRWIQVTGSIVITSVILTIVFVPDLITPDDPVSHARVWFNVIGTIAFICFVIVFFKEIQYGHQRKIEEQGAVLKTMNATMENIFYIISHDIRSPLNSVQEMLMMFQNNMIPEEMVRANIPSINNRIVQLNESLNNLLKWSARNISGMKPYPVDVQVTDLLREALYFIELQSEQKDLRIKTTVDDSLIVHVDRDQIIVVLRNVISNAVKFSHIGGTIHIFVERAGTMVVVRIVDEGIGIDGDKLQHLFEDLQVPEIGTNGERGTGLGLWLCRELLRQNHGNLTVSSEQHIGSTFAIYIPESKFGSKVLKKDVQRKEKSSTFLD